MRIDGKYYKKLSVVMLPGEGSRIRLIGNHLSLFDNPQNSNSGYTSQHLYFLSEEKIKEEDWWLNIDSPKPRIATKEDLIVIDRTKSISCRKIIASTDKSLKIKVGRDFSSKDGWIYKELPRPSDGFLRTYCEKKDIKEVLVEYELVEDKDDLISLGSDGTGDNFYGTKELLKVASDNTVSIRPTKDSWSREEVLQLMEEVANYVRCSGYGPHSTTRGVARMILEGTN